jgi:hypothetical protein
MLNFIKTVIWPIAFLLAIGAVILLLGNARDYLDANLQRDATRLLLAVIVIYGLLLLSRWMDRRAGINFKEEWHAIRDGNIAVALYLGLRIFGIFLFGAAILFLT